MVNKRKFLRVRTTDERNSKHKCLKMQNYECCRRIYCILNVYSIFMHISKIQNLRCVMCSCGFWIHCYILQPEDFIKPSKQNCARIYCTFLFNVLLVNALLYFNLKVEFIFKATGMIYALSKMLLYITFNLWSFSRPKW